MSENQCDSCEHSCSYSVKVGDCAYGNDVEEWCCMKEDDPRMADWDCEGDCPCFEERKEEYCEED